MRRYLLVTHIPFMRKGDQIIIDQLWANELAELTRHVGAIRVAAPEIPYKEDYTTWGPKMEFFDASIPVSFAGFPPMYHSWELITRWKIQSILKREVEKADVVHSSNAFNPYLGLLYAHFLAVRLNKKTVFVVAEDFHDSLIWEWVRISKYTFQKFCRSLVVKHMDRLMQRAVSTASLSFFFTPAAVKRFRLYASNGVAVRDTTHRNQDIISEEMFQKKCREISSGAPLKLIAACRHKPLKGVEFIIRAVGELKQRGILVEVNLYGHGPETEKLTHLAKSLDVSDRVFFPGALSANQAVFSALASHHISLMTHRTNEFARALYDALAGGTPVIAFQTPASEGSLRPEVDGLFAPLDNAIALSVAIERLHQDRKLLIDLARNARDRAFLETKSIWHKFRAGLIEELFNKGFD